MSETVHYKGVLTEIKNNLQDVQDVAGEILNALNLKKDSSGNHESNAHELMFKLPYDYLYNEKTCKLYFISKESFKAVFSEPNILDAKRITDGLISYEVRFYTGCDDFSDRLLAALSTLFNEKQLQEPILLSCKGRCDHGYNDELGNELFCSTKQKQT